MQHEDFVGWMEQQWVCEGVLKIALKHFAIKLRARNKATFGNIFQRKKLNEMRLGGVQRELSK